MEGKKTKNGSFIIVEKEIKLLFKSKRRIFLLIMMPIIIITGGIITAFTVPNDIGQPVGIQVLDENPTNMTAAFKSLLMTINDTKYTEISGDYATIVNQSKYQVFVYIPANFTNLIENNNQSSIYIYYNDNSPQYKQVAIQVLALADLFEKSLIFSLHPEVNFNLIQENLVSPPVKQGAVNEDLRAISVIIPVYIILFVVISPLSLILISVTIEREQKTLEMLFLQPVNRRDIVLGKLYYGLSLVLITLILDILAVIGSVYSFILISGIPTEGLASQIIDALRSIDPMLYVGFVAAMMIISVLLVAAAILLSLLAKDEREANMISGLLPMLIVGMMFVLFVIPVEELGVGLQALLVCIPVSGTIFAIYLASISGTITWLSWLSFALQIVWSGVVVDLIVRLSEAESILELNYSKLFTMMKKMILRK